MGWRPSLPTWVEAAGLPGPAPADAHALFKSSQALEKFPVLCAERNCQPRRVPQELERLRCRRLSGRVPGCTVRMTSCSGQGRPATPLSEARNPRALAAACYPPNGVVVLGSAVGPHLVNALPLGQEFDDVVQEVVLRRRHCGWGALVALAGGSQLGNTLGFPRVLQRDGMLHGKWAWRAQAARVSEEPLDHINIAAGLQVIAVAAWHCVLNA